MLRGLLASAPMFTCAFWFVALLLDYRRYDRAKIILALFMFVTCIHFFCQAALCSIEYELTSKIDTIYIYVTLSVFPLYYLYIRALTDRNKITFRSLWIFLPAFIIGTIAAVLYYRMSPEEADAFVHLISFREPGTYNFSRIGELQKLNLRIMDYVFALLILPVAYWGVIRIRKYNSQLLEYYSNQEGKRLAPIKSWLYFFVYACVMSFGFNAIGRYHFVEPMWMLFAASILFSIMLFTLGFVGFRQDFTIENFIKDEAKTNEPDIDTSTNVVGQDNFIRMRVLEVKLLTLLQEKELFREPDLRISDLASHLGSNRAYVSRIINQNLQTTFSDLINSYRVEYAKKLLTESHNMPMSVTEVAETSGFSSESSFYRIFKKATGVSPKVWRSQYSAK